jgi:hypothetical protein
MCASRCSFATVASHASTLTEAWCIMASWPENRTPCETLKGPDVWRRQPGETSLSYSYFRKYRDMGETRTLRRTAKELGRNVTLVEDRARRWRWAASPRGRAASTVWVARPSRRPRSIREVD